MAASSLRVYNTQTNLDGYARVVSCIDPVSTPPIAPITPLQHPCRFAPSEIGMSSGGNRSGYHGGSKNPDQQKYRKFLDELDDLFPCEGSTGSAEAPNTGNS
jgi:hypothetical protein